MDIITGRAPPPERAGSLLCAPLACFSRASWTCELRRALTGSNPPCPRDPSRYTFVLDPVHVHGGTSSTTESSDGVDAGSDREQAAQDAIRDLVTTEEWDEWGKDIQQMMPGRVDRRTFEVYKRHREATNEAAARKAELVREQEAVRAMAARERAEFERQRSEAQVERLEMDNRIDQKQARLRAETQQMTQQIADDRSRLKDEGAVARADAERAEAEAQREQTRIAAETARLELQKAKAMADVDAAQAKLKHERSELMANARKLEQERTGRVWECELDDGRWQPYDPAIAAVIDAGFKKHGTNPRANAPPEFKRAGIAYSLQFFDSNTGSDDGSPFLCAHQINLETGVSRMVRFRTVLRLDPALAKSREFWESEGRKGLADQKLFAVKEGSVEHQRVAAEFGTTMPGVLMHSVERIENGHQHMQFSIKSSAIAQKLGQGYDKASMLRLLFHGTKTAEAAQSIINNSTDGFRPLLSGSATGAVHGDGVYFARDASYSHNYAVKLPGGRRQMLVASVALGRCTKGRKGERMPPLLPESQFDRFNSFVNDEANPSIFVVQDGSQAYPKYRITYG